MVIYKENLYKLTINATRMACSNGDNTNHLAIECKRIDKQKSDFLILGFSNRSVKYTLQKPCFIVVALGIPFIHANKIQLEL